MEKGAAPQNNALSESEFKNPDKSHYPETWFHFIGGNVSKTGITADLEAIAQAKISGIQLFHGQFGGEWPGVSPQIKCLSESWDDLIRWTAQECKRLGLHFAMQNCPGWSYAGGPWIEPENSMRHLTFSRTDAEGGKTSLIHLPKPNVGNEEWRDYQDLFVIAFPTPLDDGGSKIVPETVTSNRKGVDFQSCLTNDKTVNLPPSGEMPTVIDVKFHHPETIRTVQFPSINSFSHAWCYAPGINVKISAEKGGKFIEIAQLEMPEGSWQDDKPISVACREIPSRHYRVELSNQHDMLLSHLNFYTAARQQNWESEAAWTLRRIVREPYPAQSPEAWVNSGRIVNLTKLFQSDGTIEWKAPEGKWTILRVGHCNTGMRNGPAPAEATGWECTKLDASGVRKNYEGYIGHLVNHDGVLKNGLLQGVLLDSWECRTQTWTNGLDSIFANKWNYSLFSKFPALFGFVVDTPESTARFLRDWRVTLNDLLVHNFFGEMKTLAKQNNLRVAFETASGDVFPGDILEYFKYADVPMCEIWQPQMESFVGSDEFKPTKPCVSAARMYGKTRVAAEAFTSFDLTWNETPRFLKSVIDYHFAQGVTHPVFHTYTHNPRTDFLPPGTSFGSNIGTPFLRLQTWWRHMPAFTDYLARCNYMLESGIPVSDVLMYLGDEQNHKPQQSLPFPEGLKYDYCNPDVLLNRLSVKDGKLVTPEGISYRILWLYDCKRMLPETLGKILSFVKQGVILVGNKPDDIATLKGGKSAEAKFQKFVDEIWGNEAGEIRKIGKGKVYATDIFSAVKSERIAPDISVKSAEVRWLHRKSGKSDFYYLSTPASQGFKGKIQFRSTGHAELWNPVSGEVFALRATKKQGGLSEIALDIPPETSFFVVFKPAKSKHKEWIETQGNAQDIRAEWTVTFPEGWGINRPVATRALPAWKEMNLTDEGKAFSGTATYSTEITVEKTGRDRLILNLGRVESIAKVRLNGKDVGTVWTAPYQIDITDFVSEGKNKLEIDVTSTWFNRLAHDAALPENQRKTWTIGGPAKNSPLKEYGLMGPVQLILDKNK